MENIFCQLLHTNEHDFNSKTLNLVIKDSCKTNNSWLKVGKDRGLLVKKFQMFRSHKNIFIVAFDCLKLFCLTEGFTLKSTTLTMSKN